MKPDVTHMIPQCGNHHYHQVSEKFQLGFLEKNVVLEGYFKLKGHQVPRVFVSQKQVFWPSTGSD
jgi:hypothetical protein